MMNAGSLLYGLAFFGALFLVHHTVAQAPTNPLPLSRYGLPVVKGSEVYVQMVGADPENELLDMRQLLPDAQFDVTYAGTNNFLKRKIYPTPDLFMRAPAARALVRASEIVKEKGFGLLLFDGYRPYSVTELFYEEIGDTTFVADPRKGSKHNRGMAIDLSLYDLKTGKQVLMPTAYDEASPKAYQDYAEGDPLALKNRAILREAMEQVGFSIFKYEWWHYDYQGWENCPTYDIWHLEIQKINSQLRKIKR
ncbi:MAG: M15 family metallopeptidase [Cyclobacteriaceae bacterium]|jgi:D-alanyl-D-alanine dipeptidase